MHTIAVGPAPKHAPQIINGDEISSGPFDPEIAAEGTVLDPVTLWAARSPDRLAMISGDRRLSYSALERRTNQIARALRAYGVLDRDSIALVLPRGIDTVLAMISVLKAGASYVPLDSEMPADRVRLCLDDAAPVLVISSPNYQTVGTTRSIDLDELFSKADLMSEAGLEAEGLQIHGSDLAYIIFTSGTTGRPKGVPIAHRSLTNFVRGNQQACIRVEESDRVFQGFSPSSDGHHEEIWPTFQAGATLVVASTNDIHSGDRLGDFLDHHGVTIISCAPTLLAMVESDVPSLRRILFGAERCPPELVRRWWRPGREIINTYGPTEATVGATFGICRPDEPITIGMPLPNYFCYVMDADLNPVEAGDEGELCIAGVGISDGYLGSEPRHSGRFVQNPFALPGRMNDTLYRTGDRVRMLDSGGLEWLGRIDSQVKIRGYRIELSDIENHLLREPTIRSAVVVARDSDLPAPTLVALVVPKVGMEIDAHSCIDRLRQELPHYMVPHVLEQVEALPVLPSGKIDRKRALSIRGQSLVSAREIVSPRTETERIIAGIWAKLFPSTEISAVDDFFTDLGGYSLLAAQFTSLMRNEHGFEQMSVLDIYENPTLDQFAAFIDKQSNEAAPPQVEMPVFSPVPPARHLIASAVQALGVLFLFGVKAWFWLSPLVIGAYFAHHGVPALACMAIGLLSHALMVPMAFLLAAAIKWTVIGRFRAGSHPVWGAYFLRWWFVERALSLVPTNYITGTPLAGLYLRLLGARVGHNVTFETLHVDCPDLIDIEDDVVVETLAWIRASQVAHGMLTLRPIRLGQGSAVGVRSGVAGGATLGKGATLDDLSCAGEGVSIPAGEEWAGSPAIRRETPRSPAYDSAQQPSQAERVRFGIAQTLLVACLPLIDMIPFLFTSLLFVRSSHRWDTYLAAPLYSLLLVIIVCAQILLVKWVVVRRMKPGVYPITGSFVLRKWFADKHFELLAESIVPVYDSLYARAWCMSLGMRCGPRAEIAVSTRLPYDLVKLGDENFLASDCSVGIPRRRNGKMTLLETRTGKRVFLGNDSVTPQGAVIPDDCLLGAMSLCPDSVGVGTVPGQTWLGSPSFRMPLREQSDQFDLEKTYRPTTKLYLERLVRETLRIILPGIFVLPLASLLVHGFVNTWHYVSPVAAILAMPFLYAGISLLAMLTVFALKRILVGTYRPTVQPLWSRYVWNTETFSVVLHDFGDPIFGLALQGTPFHAAYLRLLGAKIGKRVFLDTLDVTECDLISIGDDAAINFNAPLQAHLFEDRVMKTGNIRIGDRCAIGNHSVVLFDTEMKPDSRVGHISLVMKGETIPPATYWMGSPARSHDAEFQQAVVRTRLADVPAASQPTPVLAGD